MFIIKTLYNTDLLNIYTDLVVDTFDNEFNPIKVTKEFVEPNHEYIKRE